MKYEITKRDVRKLREMMRCYKKNVTIYNRLKAVALRGSGYTNEQVAPMVDLHYKRVSQLVSLYANEGIKALATDGRKGGNHRNMTFEEEAEILKEFFDLAVLGQVVSVNDIRAKYEKKLGRETKPSFIYKVLERHKWRQVMPRVAHPKKASEAEIEASKKLTQNCTKSDVHSDSKT